MANFLIVDDSPTIRLTLRRVLERLRGRVMVSEAGTGEDGIRLFRERPTDVVFLDLMLGQGKQGLEVLGEMLRVNPEACVVLITGLPPGHQDVVAAISLGAFDYLEKPVRTEAVQRILHAIDQEEGRLGRIA